MEQNIIAPEPSAVRQKILVIEDEEGYRNIITSTLQMSGYEVFEAENGLDGLAMIKSNKPDLIFCDINMPKMDGNELLSIVKKEKEFAGIPFIFLTGNIRRSDQRHGMELGADDYLTKPFSVEELLAVAQARLSKKKSLQRYYESQFDDIKDSIVRSLPHEFRTPLNSILGYAQILEEEENIPADEVKKIGARLFASGNRLQHLLENLVLFGQIQFWLKDPQKIKTLREEGESTLLENLRLVSETQMIKHKRAGEISLPVNDEFIQASSIHFSKILEEIIDNALKFSNAGTMVYISNTHNASKVYITIRDEGRGMSEAQIAQVSAFHQFERGYYEQQGAGLGLVIASMLTELYQGSLAIQSELGKGTTVTISLPKVNQN